MRDICYILIRDDRKRKVLNLITQIKRKIDILPDDFPLVSEMRRSLIVLHRYRKVWDSISKI